MEDGLPKQLVAECRARRREHRVCVKLFGTENNWSVLFPGLLNLFFRGWYLPSEISHLEMGENKNVDAINGAKTWLVL